MQLVLQKGCMPEMIHHECSFTVVRSTVVLLYCTYCSFTPLL